MTKDDEGLDRFAPPPEVEAPLELDPEWVAQRAAKQTAWAERPKPKRHIGGVIAALVLIAVAIAVIAYIVKS